MRPVVRLRLATTRTLPPANSGPKCGPQVTDVDHCGIVVPFSVRVRLFPLRIANKVDYPCRPKVADAREEPCPIVSVYVDEPSCPVCEQANFHAWGERHFAGNRVVCRFRFSAGDPKSPRLISMRSDQFNPVRPTAGKMVCSIIHEDCDNAVRSPPC